MQIEHRVFAYGMVAFGASGWAGHARDEQTWAKPRLLDVQRSRIRVGIDELRRRNIGQQPINSRNWRGNHWLRRSNVEQ